MRHLFARLLLATALWVPAAGASADQFETFHLDPSRSFLSLDNGAMTADLPNQQFFFSNLLLQAGVAPAPLGGEFVMRIGNDAANPTFFQMLAGTSDIRPSDVNLVSPGVGGVPGVTAAAIGVTFSDPGVGISGSAAIHDLIFGTTGFFSPSANGLGPNGLQGDLAWTAVSGLVEVETNLGIGGTALVPVSGSSSGFVDRHQSQFREIAPGVYEVVVPFVFNLMVGPAPGPFDNLQLFLGFTGEIVATTVPEPSVGLLLFAAGVGCVWGRTRMGDAQ